MKAPHFWKESNLISKILAPFGSCYNFVVQLRRRLTSAKKVEVPVICVGSILVGGSGKTPVTAHLVKALKASGLTAHILSRGYKAKLPGPLAVNATLHKAADVGDEPLLLAEKAHVWIGKDRLKSALKAIQHGAHVLVLDDGFQNPRLAKDCNILVFDGYQQIGNGQVFPAGPLRERLETGLKQADIVVLIDFETTPEWCQHDHIFHAKTQYHLLPTATNYLAFAGIGYPEKFFQGLRKLGFNVVATRPFADHYTYSQADIKALIDLAKEHDAQLITTLKDYVKIPKTMQNRIEIQTISLDFPEESALLNDIIERVKKTAKVMR